MTSLGSMRTQPCEAALPSEARSAVPWKPTEPLKPIQRALSGLSGAPPGIVCAGEVARPVGVRDVPRRVDLHSSAPCRCRSASGIVGADGDAVGLGQLAAVEDAHGGLSRETVTTVDAVGASAHAGRAEFHHSRESGLVRRTPSKAQRKSCSRIAAGTTC